ncbi:MAG TPA: protein kinase [Verrucomicrobiae bacterium]|nr:protein kinase [Verrucomicrobiae bacterium]
MNLHPGGRLGGYEIIARIAEGGMGAVWRARDVKLGRLVAIKVVKSEGPSERLLKEARTAARLNHPNIVTIHEVGECEGDVFVVMELAEGSPLVERMARAGMPLAEGLAYAVPIARALEAAHKMGVVHRDLKPANVMVAPDGHVKLLDFGLAKEMPQAMGLATSEETRTAAPPSEEGKIAGTIAYMSPEQAQGKPVDGRSDIFSFGTLLYEMLVGRRPFDREDRLSTLAAILCEEPPPLAHGLPEAADRLVMRCLRKDPDRRFQTGADLRAALEDLKDESESSGAAVRATPPRRRRTAIAASVAAIGAITAAVFWAPWRQAPPATLPAPAQITFDGGIAATPAISPDGKLFAFASDRAEPGNLDIWLRQMTGGTPERLTSRPGVEYNPQFSSDGTRLYYLTGNQEIEEMPALGGPARTVAANAGPFTVSNANEIAFTRPMPAAQPGPMFVMAAGGGAPQPWRPECAALSRPVWSADGKQLTFFGRCGGDQRGGYYAPRAGGNPVRLCDSAGTPSGAAARAPVSDVLFPVAGGVLRVVRGGRVNLVASPVGLPLPTRMETVIDSAGALMFSKQDPSTSIWGMGGRMESGATQEIVTGIGHFGVSRDGSTLAYGRLASQKGGELAVRNLRTGEERVFAAHELLNAGYGSIWPQVSPDGKQVFYRLAPGQQGGESGHFILRLDTGEARKVAGLTEFQLASDWTADGKRVLGECAPPRFGICELDPANGTVRKVFVHPKDQLLYPSQSRDGNWMVFGRREPGGMAGIWIARVTADGLESEGRWKEISPPNTDNSRPRFSVDGGSVYYVLGQGGMRQFAAQKIDALTGAASGPISLPLRRPLELTALTGGGGPYPLISVTAGSVYYSTIVLRGNIWTARLQ